MRPNIVQIVCHDLGRHLGCYGVPTVHTPALDRLAAEGVRFTRSFCTAPGCSPSRAALATGRYPHANGCMGLAHAHFGWELSEDERHVAGLLAGAGYRTALFGLQHVTYHLERLGFQEVFPERPADAVAANLEGFFRGGAGSGPGEPFYAEVNFFEPHRPFDFGGVAPDTERGVFVPAYLSDDEPTRAELAGLQGAIRKVDDSVARILRALEAAGLTGRTLLLFTADHGIAFPRAKGTLYDAGIEVALIVRWPDGGLRPGVRGELASNVDVVPTYLEAAGGDPRAPLPPDLHGTSLLPLLRGEAGPAREAVFAEKTYHEHYDPQRAVRTARYKLVHPFEVSNRAYVPGDIGRGGSYPPTIADLSAERGRLELYDLEADPGERNNLAADPAHAGVLEDLGGRLRAWMRETGDPLLRGPVPSPFYHGALEQLERF